MRAVILDEDFGFANLRTVERPDPKPGPDEVLVRIKAVSLNYRDLLLIEGQYNPRQSLPVIPVSDGAGTVVSVGQKVTRFRPGDHVVNVFMERWPAGDPTSASFAATRGGPGGDGLLADFAVFHESAVLAIPDHLSFVEAATLPCAAMTAWSAVIEQGRLRPGSSVVIEGTGGVALFAQQFARMAGARTMVLSSSDDKLSWIADLGADATANYATNPEWWRRVRETFSSEGADLVVELGGAETLENALRAVRPGGTVALIGVLSGAHAPLNLPLVVMRQVRLQGITCGSREAMQRMLDAIRHHRLRPWIHETFSFDDYAEAFALMHRGSHVGKIVIRLDDN